MAQTSTKRTVVPFLCVGGIGGIFLLMFFGLFHWAKVENEALREKKARVSQEASRRSPVKILQVSYIGTGPNAQMLVTCESPDGNRFNLRQAWDSLKIPIVGERWSLRSDEYLIVFHEKID